MEKTIDKLKKIIRKHDLKHKSREREYVYKRHFFSWYAYNKLGLSFAHIGRLTGRHHATIINSRDEAQAMIDTKDKLFYDLTKTIQDDLGLCPFPEYKKQESNVKEVFNRIFEIRDMKDVKALKAFINENIDPKSLE